MITIDKLREFVVFARYLNISKAASALYMSQPTLSKHLQQLEWDLDYPLIKKQGNNLFLTDEGAHFLEGLQVILSELDELNEECRLIKDHNFIKLVIQDPAYTDNASVLYFELIEEMRRAKPTIQVDFIHEQHCDLKPLLMSDNMQIMLEYHLFPACELKAQYASQGLEIYEIASEPLAGWGRSYAFEGRSVVALKDLRDKQIMLSSEASSPMIPLYGELPDVLGYQPKFFISAAQLPAQYYYSGTKQSVFLLPQSYASKDYFASRGDMATVSFENDSLLCHCCAIMNSQARCSSFLRGFLQSAEQRCEGMS